MYIFILRDYNIQTRIVKRSFALALCVLLFQAANAQTGERIFKKFKVDLSIGYAIPEASIGADAIVGVVVAIEPKYSVIDQISVGLRMEAALMAGIDKDRKKGGLTASGSYLVTGDYYFSNNKLRPFAGLGAGVFTNSDGISDVNSKFGLMTRAGIEYSHLCLGFEYNFVPDKAGYLSLKIGVCIGGGRK